MPGFNRFHKLLKEGGAGISVRPRRGYKGACEKGAVIFTGRALRKLGSCRVVTFHRVVGAAGSLGGLVIMEIIFVVPGMGAALIQAVSQRDYPTVQAMVFVMALVFLTVNLAVDLLYAWLDPRIRYA